MRKGRLKRNWLVIVMGIIATVIGLSIKINPNDLKNFTEIMSASLSFSAIVTAIFFASFSLIPSSDSNKLVSMIEDLGTDIKIMDRLLVATVLSFLSSVFSFVALFFDKHDTSMMSVVLISAWLSSTVMMFTSSFLVLRVLIKLVELYNEYRKKK